MTSRTMIRYGELGLWSVAVICLVMTGAMLWRAHAPTHPLVAPLPAAVDDVAMYDRKMLTQTAESVIANDVFRSERRPTRVAFGATPPPAAAPPPARPHPTVGGILGGPPWRVVLNGVPNHDGGVVMAPGDTLGGLWIRWIRRDTVKVEGQDTTWTLTVEH